MSRMSDILKGLINRTEEEKLTWRTSADTNAFVTSVDTISVVVRSSVIRSSLNSLFSEIHRLEIQNDKGITVEVLETPAHAQIIGRGSDATAEEAEELSRLFKLARRSALDTDSTLDKLATNLANFP